MKICILSSCNGVWGGSEELWAGLAHYLSSQRAEIHIFKPKIDPIHTKYRNLSDCGCHLTNLTPLWFAERLHGFLSRRLALPHPLIAYLRLKLRRIKPKFCIVSQGQNFDGVLLAEACRLEKVPYCIICQKASDIFWPLVEERSIGERVFLAAQLVLFVSQHNWRLTERQMGIEIPRARVVQNPVLVSPSKPLPWPQEQTLKLACVARLYAPDKGQDMLFDVLSREKWRQRDVSLTLVGDGIHRESFEACVRHLGLSKVHFLGQVERIEDIWRDHHALVLSSRAEGTPLSALEALSCGRPCVLTPAAGNAELLSEPGMGFLAPSISVEGLSEAMDAMWDARESLEDMGTAAYRWARRSLDRELFQRLGEELMRKFGCERFS